MPIFQPYHLHRTKSVCKNDFCAKIRMTEDSSYITICTGKCLFSTKILTAGNHRSLWRRNDDSTRTFRTLINEWETPLFLVCRQKSWDGIYDDFPNLHWKCTVFTKVLVPALFVLRGASWRRWAAHDGAAHAGLASSAPGACARLKWTDQRGAGTQSCARFWPGALRPLPSLQPILQLRAAACEAPSWVVSKTPVVPANSALHIAGCCSVLPTCPADQLLASRTMPSVPVSPSATATSYISSHERGSRQPSPHLRTTRTPPNCPNGPQRGQNIRSWWLGGG